jgi:hypothetical protein
MPLANSLCAMREEQIPAGEEFVDRLAEPRQQHNCISARAIDKAIGGRIVQELDDVRERGTDTAGELSNLAAKAEWKEREAALR